MARRSADCRCHARFHTFAAACTYAKMSASDGDVRLLYATNECGRLDIQRACFVRSLPLEKP
eukprot:6205798-Pleurochrysis_carterae.AAC.2